MPESDASDYLNGEAPKSTPVILKEVTTLAGALSQRQLLAGTAALTAGGFLARIGVAFGEVTGPDGNIWFPGHQQTRSCGSPRRVLSPRSNPPTESSRPFSLALGPDGALWFTEWAGNKIGRITTDGHITEFPIPTPQAQPRDIVAAGGSLWFSEYGADEIGRISTCGHVCEFELSTREALPLGITYGSDGALWFCETAANNIGRITPCGDIKEFPLPVEYGCPFYIAAGPDGALWFGGRFARSVGRITIDDTITLFPTDPGGLPLGIATGPDNKLWFTDYARNKLCRMTTGGFLTEFSIPLGHHHDGEAH